MYLIGRILPAGIGFGGIALYTHLLDPASFGTYALLLSASFVIGLTGFSWLRVAALRTLSTISNDELPDVMATMAVSFLGICGVATVAILVALHWYKPGLSLALSALTVGVALASNWFELNVALAQARIRLITYGVLQTARASLTLGVSVVLIFAGLKAEALLCGFVVGNCAAFGALGVWSPAVRGRFRRHILVRLLRFGWPSSAGSLSVCVVPIQRYLLDVFGGTAAVGLLAVATDFAGQTLGLLMGTVTIAGQPLAFRARDLGNKEQLDEQLRNNARLLFAVGIAATVGLIVLAGPISHVFFGAKFRAGAEPVIAIAAACTFCANLRSNYFEQGFEIALRTRPIAIIMIVRVVMTLVPTFFLIPRFGAIGAALSILIAEATALVVSVVWARRLIDMPVPLYSFARIVAAAAAMALVLELVPNRSSVLGLIAAMTLGSLTYAVACALMYPRQIASLVRLPRRASQVMTRP
jgi:O-antigen/teichoic acid export membrane protein